MANEVRLLGPDGRPIRKRDLTREAGRPTVTGVRQVWHGETMASGLTPQRLAALLRTAAEGSHRDYLTLAEEMEERDTPLRLCAGHSQARRFRTGGDGRVRLR